MEQIDRLGWAAGLAFETYGLRLGVRVTDARLLEALAERLPPAWKRAKAPVGHLYSVVAGGSAAGGVRRFHLAYAAAERIARSLHLDEVLDVFENHLKLFVAERAPRFVFVHAGVVGFAGRAILLPGRSHAGKSRLVEALVRVGCRYYSDEFAVLDAGGRVHPYLAPLRIRGEREGEIRRLQPPEIDGSPRRRPLPVGLIVETVYRKGGRWRPRRLTEGQGVLTLLDNTVPARCRPSQSLDVLGATVRSAVILRSPREEASDTAGRLLEALLASCRPG